MMAANGTGQSYPLLAVVVLNWNGLDETRVCVECLLKVGHPNYHIVVVDNASSDGSEEKIRSAFPSITVLQAGANNGYAAGNNIGMKHALQCGAERILLLNNDAYISITALKTLLNVLERNPRLGAVGPTLAYDDQSIRISSAGTALSRFTAKPVHIRTLPSLKSQEEYVSVPYLTGACLLVRSEVVRTVGLLPEAYFLYYEDCEWGFAIRRAGWLLGYVPGCSVVHLEQTSARKDSTVIPYYYWRNYWLYVARNPDATPHPLRARAIHLVQSTIDLFAFLFKREPRSALALLIGTLDGLSGRSGKRRAGRAS